MLNFLALIFPMLCLGVAVLFVWSRERRRQRIAMASRLYPWRIEK